MTIIHRKSDDIISVPVILEETGEQYDASTINDAIYQILDCEGGTILLEKRLNDGVTIDGVKLLVQFGHDDLDDINTGEMWHRMAILTVDNKRTPPIFSESLTIKEGLFE